jgi:hypothetical protein
VAEEPESGSTGAAPEPSAPSGVGSPQTAKAVVEHLVERKGGDRQGGRSRPAAAAAAPAEAPSAPEATPGPPLPKAEALEAAQSEYRRRQQERQSYDQLQRQLNEIRQAQQWVVQQVQQAQAPRAQEDPEPPFEQDPKGWYLWRDRQSGRELRQALAEQQYTQQQAAWQQQLPAYAAQVQEVQAQQAIYGMATLEQEYATRVAPGYYERVAAFQDHQRRFHEAAGHTYQALRPNGQPVAAAQLMAEGDILNVMQQALAAGEHPAVRLDRYATAVMSQRPRGPQQEAIEEMAGAAGAPEAGSLGRGAAAQPAEPAKRIVPARSPGVRPADIVAKMRKEIGQRGKRETRAALAQTFQRAHELDRTR